MALDFSKYGATVATPSPPSSGPAPMPTSSSDFSGYGEPVAPPMPAPAPQPPDVLGHLTKAVGSIFPGSKVGESIGTLGGYGMAALADFFNHLHGNPTTYAKNFDTTAPTPAETTGDVAKGAGVIGSIVAPTPATLAGAATQGAVLSGIMAGGDAAAQGGDASSIVKKGALGATVGAVAGGGIFGIGKMLSSLGDKIVNSAIKPTQRDIQDGFSMDTIHAHDLGGNLTTMYTKTEAKLGKLSEELNSRLQSSPNAVNLHDVFQQTAEELAANKAKGFGSNTSLNGALEQLQNEILTLDKADVSIPEAQLVKQAAGKMGAWQFGSQDPSATAREKVYNTFYSHLKTAIEQNSPDGVKEINKQISQLIPVQNAIVRRIPVAERNNALSLTDMIGLVGSALNPKALALLGLSVAQKQGSVGHLLSRFVGPAVQSAATPIGSAVGALGPVALPEVGSTPTPAQ